MSALATYWAICIMTPIILSLWVYTKHRKALKMNDLNDTARGFSWRRDFVPAAVLIAALFTLVLLMGD